MRVNYSRDPRLHLPLSFHCAVFRNLDIYIYIYPRFTWLISLNNIGGGKRLTKYSPEEESVVRKQAGAIRELIGLAIASSSNKPVIHYSDRYPTTWYLLFGDTRTLARSLETQPRSLRSIVPRTGPCSKNQEIPASSCLRCTI